MDSELKQLEDQLSKLAPSAMPKGMLQRMEEAMHGWQGAGIADNVCEFSNDVNLDDELLSFEAGLAAIKPNEVSSELSDELETAMVAELDEDLRRIEGELAGVSASSMPADLTAKLVAAMEDAAAEQDKVVAFTAVPVPAEKGGALTKFNLWASAATVAVLAVAGVVVVGPFGNNNNKPNLADNEGPKPVPANSVGDSERLVSVTPDVPVARTSSDIVNVSNGDIVTPEKGEAYREVRVKYKDVYRGEKDGKVYYYTKDRIHTYRVKVESN